MPVVCNDEVCALVYGQGDLTAEMSAFGPGFLGVRFVLVQPGKIGRDVLATDTQELIPFGMIFENPESLDVFIGMFQDAKRVMIAKGEWPNATPTMEEAAAEAGEHPQAGGDGTPDGGDAATDLNGRNE